MPALLVFFAVWVLIGATDGGVIVVLSRLAGWAWSVEPVFVSMIGFATALGVAPVFMFRRDRGAVLTLVRIRDLSARPRSPDRPEALPPGSPSTGLSDYLARVAAQRWQASGVLTPPVITGPSVDRDAA